MKSDKIFYSIDPSRFISTTAHSFDTVRDIGTYAVSTPTARACSRFESPLLCASSFLH